MASLNPYVALCQGLIALEEYRYEDAKSFLTQSLEQPEPIAPQAWLVGFNVLINIHLAMAMSKLGAREPAAALMQEAEPLLLAWRETELLERCKAALSD